MEFQYESLDAGNYDTDVLRAVGAIQLASLPQVELGARVGIGDTEAPSSINDGDGLTDLDVWGKLRLGPMRDGTVWASGFRIRIPTGVESAGLGTDALSTKLLVAARQRVPHGTLSYHAAVEATEDSIAATSSGVLIRSPRRSSACAGGCPIPSIPEPPHSGGQFLMSPGGQFLVSPDNRRSHPGEMPTDLPVVRCAFDPTDVLELDGIAAGL